MLKEGFEPIPGYRLLNFLGRGQFGEVWRATSPGGTYIALKFLNVQERQGRKEFRAIQKVKGIRYPHLVQTYALWLLDENMHVIDDAAFDSSQPILVDSVRATMIRQPMLQADVHKPSMLVIATVLCDQNLMERLSDCKKKGERGIPAQELLGYIEDAAKAIDFLNAPRHELGEGAVAIHHCDIKPENIMILGDLAVVGDFGVARILGSGADSRATTTMGGSVAYAAPETFDNRTAATSDQYSLAITYYELRTGKLPFPEETQSQVMRDKLSGRLDFADVSPQEAKVLRRATSVEPLKRFQSARSFVEALQSAVSGKKNEKRSVGIGTIIVGTSAIALIIAFAVLFLKPTVVIPDVPEKELEKLDGAALYTEALEELRRSDLGSKSIGDALEKSVPAIKEGGYVPVVSNAMGLEPTPIFQTHADSLDEKHCLKLIAMSSDQTTLVKAVNHTLHFSSLLSDQSKQMELRDTDVIEQLVWLKNEIVLLDKQNRLMRIEDVRGLPKQDQLISKEVVIRSELPESRNWLGMQQSGNRNRVVLLHGKESKSPDLFSSKPAVFHSMIYQEGGNAIDVANAHDMQWKDRRPSLYIDEEGEFFLAGAIFDGGIGTFTVSSSSTQSGFNFVSQPAMKELQEFTKVVFSDVKSGFLLAGIAKDTEEDFRVVSGALIDQKWELNNVPLPNALPIGALFAESPNSVLIAQATKLLRCTRESFTSEWGTKELFDFEDGLLQDGASQEGATGRINAICKLNERWIMTGHETGRSMVLSQDVGSTPSGFAICPKLDCAIQDIKLTQNRIVLIGQDGRLIWFDLAEILLNAESCKKAGVAPRNPPSNSVRS